MRRILLALALAITCGCVTESFLQPTPHASLKLCFNKKQMREEIFKHLYVGMPIADARRIMLDSGFRAAGWAEFWESKPEEHGPGTTREVYNAYLSSRFMVDDVITVELFQEFDKLTNVEVDCYSVGM